MNIAIIGGSITEGAGASEYSNSYVYKLEEYLKGKYKDENVKNLGAGSTASNFGLFRLKRDLGDFKPDVIFIEFAVNDRIYNSMDSSIYFEGLLRECTKFTEKILIVDLPTGMCDSCTNIHKKFAYFYDIPLIDVQDEVWRKIGKRELTWTKISVDNLHPNDRGHELYFEIIKNNLEYVDINNLKVNMDFRVLSKYKFNSPVIVAYDSTQIEYYGDWHEENFDLNNKFKFGAMTNSIGNGVVFKFKGKHLSMMNLLSEDSGILECKLDEYTFNIDLYMDSKGYFNTTINSYNLDNGEHTLTMVVNDKKNENSLGNKVVIGGFLIDPGI
jgi:lysophospholipase L1-like esterase